MVQRVVRWIQEGIGPANQLVVKTHHQVCNDVREQTGSPLFSLITFILQLHRPTGGGESTVANNGVREYKTVRNRVREYTAAKNARRPKVHSNCMTINHSHG